MVTKKFILNFWPFFLLLLFTTFIVWPLFLPGFFSHHDDLQVMRIFEMRKCIEDFQIPCRWVPDMGYGNGYPLFNYYGVSPYYIGAIGSYFLGFIGSAKLLFFIAASLAGVSMYLLARNLLGTYPGLLSATLYMFAPYRALDIYVRGAVAESFSIAIIPLIFYFAFRLIKENLSRFRIGLALSFAVFLTSHNIMVILFLPVISMLFLIWFWQRKFTTVKSLIFSLLLGFGLSAFFIVPAFLEKNLVQIDNLTRLELNFRGHFVTLYQLFLDRSWGYGASFPGTGDTISFQIGWPHYFLIIASIFSIPFMKGKDRKLLVLYFGLLFIFIASLFMTHIRSVFIWEQIGILRFIQFPWRFLAVTIFSASLIGGFVIYNLSGYQKIIVTIVLIAIIIFLNASYFRPQQFIYHLTDTSKLSGQFWETQQKAAILDYLPVGAVEPREAASDKPIVLGKADIEYFKKRSNRWDLKINVESKSQVIMPIFDFPNWQVFEGGRILEHSKDEIGRVTFVLEPGEHLIFAKLTNTLIRTLSNLISVAVVFYILFYAKIRRVFK